MENKMYEIFFTDCEGKLTVLKEPQDGCWINMLDPTRGKKLILSAVWCMLSGISLRPRLTRRNVRGSNRKTTARWCLPISPVVESTAESTYNFMYSTMPMGIVVCKECVITVCLKKTQLIKDFLDNRVKTFATFKKNRFLLQLIVQECDILFAVSAPDR